MTLLLETLRDPSRAVSLTPAEWGRLLPLAQRARVLARLGALLGEQGLLGRIPDAAAERMEGALALARHRQTLARWEVDRLERALTGIPVALLKGTAYVLAGLPPARGRGFADVDLLVPFDRLGEVEARLTAGGWEFSNLDAYDQRYFRRWMHELPPLKHPQRQVEVDVHHALLPRTARLHPDSARLWEQTRTLPGTTFQMLSPCDLVLHSATHLFYHSELDGDLRDLVDLHDLLGHFGEEGDFWDRLPPRAQELDLLRPLHYALRYCRRLLGTPVPETVLQAVGRRGGPGPAAGGMMDALVPRGLLPVPAGRGRLAARAARWLLYVRSHWLRMPPLLLTRHLFHKAFVSRSQGRP
ncbi:MAG: nucleotidyltransferase family protein [Deferrisomatales bacterium]